MAVPAKQIIFAERTLDDRSARIHLLYFPVQSRSRIFLHKSPSHISIRINTSRFIHNDPADQRRMMLQKFHIFSVNICKSLRPFIC